MRKKNKRTQGEGGEQGEPLVPACARPLCPHPTRSLERLARPAPRRGSLSSTTFMPLPACQIASASSTTSCTSCSWMTRRHSSHSLARAFSGELEAAARPFPFALQTRGRAPVLTAWRQCCVQLSNSSHIVSLDGRSASDTINRATLLAKLRDTVPSLLPFA